MFWKKNKNKMLSIPDNARRGVLKYAWLPKLAYNEYIILSEGEEIDNQLGYVWLDFYVDYERYDLELKKWVKTARTYGDYNCDEVTIEALKMNDYTDDEVWVYWVIKKRKELGKELENELKKELKKESSKKLSCYPDVNIGGPGPYKLEPIEDKNIIPGASLDIDCTTRPPFNKSNGEQV